MKKMQRILISLLLVFALAGLPAAEIFAASYDVSGELNSTVLYPGDSLTGITEGMTLRIDGAEISAEGGSWTNTSDAAYQVTKGDDVIVLSKVETAQETPDEENAEEAQGEEGAQDEAEASPENEAAGEAPEEGEQAVPEEWAEPGQEDSPGPEEYAEPAAQEEGWEEPAADVTSDQAEPVEEAETGPVDGVESEPAQQVDPVEIVEQETEALPAVYLLTVQDSTGTDMDQVYFENYAAGDEISLRADDLTDEGFVFDTWELDSMNVEEGDLSAEVIQFTMPERDVTITAVYSEIVEEPEFGAETEAGTETESETEAGTETESESGTGTEAESESGTETEPAAESESETETETDTETESESETETESESETETETEPESDADMGLMTLTAGKADVNIEVENGGLSEDVEYNEKDENYTFAVTADEPAKDEEKGYSFTGWTAKYEDKVVALYGDIDEEEEAELSFNGEFNDGDTIVVTANYALVTSYVNEEDNLTIIVENGRLDGDLIYDGNADEYSLSVIAEEPDHGKEQEYSFTKWTATLNGNEIDLTGDVDEEETEVSFTVKGDLLDAEIILTANYEEKEKSYELIIAGGYTSDGGDLHYFPGDDVSVTVYAELDDSHEFSYWLLETDPDLDGDFLETVKGFNCTNDPVNLTFSMPEADVVLTAVIERKETEKQTEEPVSLLYKVTVENGYAAREEYYAGETVAITSNYPETDREFNAWTTTNSDVSFENDTRATTTFTMPENDVYVEATYKDGPVSYIDGIEEGATYQSEEKLTFTPVGGGMSNTDPNPGDIRYVPTSYQIGNVSNTWSSAPYTTSMSIKKAGEYTLTVDFTKQIWDGSDWADDGKTTQASVTFYIEGSSTAGSVQTGDNTPLLVLEIIVVIAAFVLIIGLIILYYRRRTNRR